MPKNTRAESRCRYLIRDVAQQKGWNTKHPQRGGNFLEEQEIAAYFPDSGLGLTKPDFLVCQNGCPAIVVEAKNEIQKIDEAISEAIEYAEAINRHGTYHIVIATGVAGEEDHGYLFKTSFFDGTAWVPLRSYGFELTSFPSVGEAAIALETQNGTTDVTIPQLSEYIAAAIDLSAILRAAKIEPSLRPKVLGAVITALYQGEIELGNGEEIHSINSLVYQAISETDHFEDCKKAQLIEALRLPDADYARLAPKMGKIVFILKNLNVKSILRTDTDFLGLLYEAFIRYGYDNNSLGIVFTPRHITRFCADLIDVTARDKVIDIACGSGGFLVASFDRMVRTSHEMGIPMSVVRESLYGFDTNPTVWALAALNMFFRGDGKSHIENASCFDAASKSAVKGRFQKALINPPFSQEDEPERDFISQAMEALETMGLLAVVVKSGIFADEDNALWRENFLKNHSVIGMISLPSDLFYPTAIDTTIMIASAHRPQQPTDRVFMAKIWNDGFKKLKGKRVETPGSQLNEVMEQFIAFRSGRETHSDLVTVISADNIISSGAEFCPEQYLPQPEVPEAELSRFHDDVLKSVLTTSVCIDGISDEVLESFPIWTDLPALEYGTENTIEYFFHVEAGKSKGESNYINGTCPYISSGDPQNSIIRLVGDVEGEVFPNGAITVTCFGKASVQPWRFMARGNGGSAVRVLIPKFRMSFSELVWFAAQINLQRWRFFYGRMAIKSRLKLLRVSAPPEPLNDSSETIAEKVQELSNHILDILHR